MDANEYALKVPPAAKSLGMVLGKAAWLGKGQQPTVAVSKPQITEAKPEPASKKKNGKQQLKKKSPSPSRPRHKKHQATRLFL